MILIAGGTGNLGQRVVELLCAQGESVRVLTRDTAKAKRLWHDAVEIVAGDVLDLSAVTQAVTGVQTVISAIHGFSGTGVYNPHTVDQQGNHHLIQAAGAAGVEHFILVSIQGATPDHPMELFRMKYVAEQEVRTSTLSWTIIRPTAFMETWAKLVGEPLIMNGATRIFGRGQNPINFVSVYDVARFVVLAVVESTMRGTVIEVGGPENLNMQQFVRTFETVTGKSGKKHLVPLLMMRLMATLMRPLNPMLARQIEAGVIMDTRDMSFDSSDTFCRYHAIAPTYLADVVRRDYGASR
jgi:uncharacterized protein YbjT (DUF2867 family)